MGYFVTLSWISLVTTLLAVQLKREFSTIILTVMNAIIMIVYCFGFMGKLKLRIFLCISFTVAYCVLVWSGLRTG